MRKLQLWLREWLRITDIVETLGSSESSIRRDISNIRVANTELLGGLGRIIANLDPLYGKSELSPERKADSDRISNEVLNRLLNDDKASKHTLGEL